MPQKHRTLLMLCLVLLIQQCYSGFYSWDNTTKYAHYYKTNGPIATQNDRTATVPYLLKTKEAVPIVAAKIAFRINSYGESGSPTRPVINIGLITQANINQIMVLANRMGAFQFYTNTVLGRICVDKRCPVDFSPNLALQPNDIIEIEVNMQSLIAKLYVPRTGFVYEAQLLEEYWRNQIIYAFFESNNVGGEVEILT